MNSESSAQSESSHDVRPAERQTPNATYPPTSVCSEVRELLSETTEVGGVAVSAACDASAAAEILSAESITAAGSNAVPERIGRYRVIRELGRGGFGTVYLAHDDAADRLVALKLPRTDRINSNRAKEAFLREARHAAKLKHPNIVTLYEVGELDGQCYLVYEYIE